MSKIYTPQELERLLVEVNLGAPLSELEAKLGRPAGGIAFRLDALTRQDPIKWNPEKTRPYIIRVRRGYWKSQQNQPEKVKQSKRRVLDYLREHPNAKVKDFESAGLSWDISLGYRKRLNAARREAGLEERLRYTRIPESQRKQRLLAYLKGHPSATKEDIRSAGYGQDLEKGYGSLSTARKAAGLVTDEYVSAAEAARRLELSRQGVSYLLEKGELGGYRLGRSVYVSIASIENRK